MTGHGKCISISKTALLVIDVQMAFVHRDEQGMPRSTPMAETNIRRLLEGFRNAGGKIIHIHHHSLEDGSPFAAGLLGAAVQEFAKPSPGESTYIKHVNSGFIGTSLEDDLRQDGVEHLILCGATANQCVESTARKQIVAQAPLVGELRADAKTPLADIPGRVELRIHRRQDIRDDARNGSHPEPISRVIADAEHRQTPVLVEDASRPRHRENLSDARSLIRGM